MSDDILGLIPTVSVSGHVLALDPLDLRLQR